MSFFLSRRGVGGQVNKFLESLIKDKNNLVIYWVTFNLHPEPKGLLDIFGQLKSDMPDKGPVVRVICRHPRSHKWGTIITSETLRNLNNCGVEVRGLKNIDDAEGDEADIDIDIEDDTNDVEPKYRNNSSTNGYGRLHAKFIVSTLSSGTVSAGSLLFGSFNLTDSSLAAACETISETKDEPSVLEAHRAAEEMWHSAVPLTSEDCDSKEETSITQSKSDGPALPVVSVSGIREVNRDKLEFIEENWVYERPFESLMKILDQKLKNYPKPEADLQWAIFLDLLKSKRKIETVYLPVGCGKTLIALRWLLQHLNDMWKETSSDTKPKPKVWYLTPNLWVKHTVTGYLESLMTDAQLTENQIKIIRAHLVVGRACEYSATSNLPVAAVIDEFHNWAATKPLFQFSPKTYTGIVNILRKNSVPMVGLSATPCRLEAGKFDRAAFLGHWLGADYEPHDASPRLTFDQAVQEGFVCDLEWHDIAQDKMQAIESVLNTATTKYGDYAEIVLGNVWEVLAGSNADAKRLAVEIIDQIAVKQARRIVIFLPPVAQRLNRFVKSFEEQFQIKFGRGKIFDFRSNGGTAPSHIFKEFGEGNASKDTPYVLMTINRFSEGVSVNDIDLLVMLRPTLSPRVAVQQIGRGVRQYSSGSFTKSQCIVLDAVIFKVRWNQWNNINPKAIDIGQLSQLTLIEARNDERAADIAQVTGLSVDDVRIRLARGGNARVETEFKWEWPNSITKADLSDEEHERPQIDIVDLGNTTLASARNNALEDEIAKVTGLTVSVVQKRLQKGGRTRVENEFDEWPSADEECDSQVDLDELGGVTLASARDNGREDEIAKVTGLPVFAVQKRLQKGGRTRVENEFDEWPIADEECDSQIDVDELGGVTLASARDDGREEEIAQVTGLSVKAVHKRLQKGGRTLVENEFSDVWPYDEEEYESQVDLDELGIVTLASARDDQREDEIAQVTGLSVKAVQRRLRKGGRTLVRNEFSEEWPEDVIE